MRELGIEKDLLRPFRVELTSASIVQNRLTCDFATLQICAMIDNGDDVLFENTR